ncbi:MAG: DNA repair protein rad50 [Thelocarpon superellum]|nr:MAG: DNA repair protein rad50 [Thelocarpon superellum]
MGSLDASPGTSSKIDKLSILGFVPPPAPGLDSDGYPAHLLPSVRSFDNTRSETIQFQTPLTLIVGYNGSGKTTIIECLKYATTGDLPPNSRGGAFIHDPKLCGEKEVLAQVKLSFKGTSGAKMVATRSLQLTVKKATRQQKSLEGQLLMIKDGERTAISSRVAELDQIMPQYLGVSRAILDSVIFCHQDESLWPMSEPSVLKKKFDEIFEAMKYTKAIDNIKVLRKKQTEELGKYKLLEQQYKIDKDRADRAERQSKLLADEIEQLRRECHQLKHDIDQATREADRLWAEAAAYEKIIGTLDGRRIEARVVRTTMEDLAQHIEQMQESDEWLTTTLENYEARVSELDQRIDVQRQEYDQVGKTIEEHRQRLGATLTDVGKYEAEKAQHDRQLAQRETLIKETARRHAMRGFDTDLDSALIDDFMVRINKMARDQTLALDRAKAEARDALQDAQAALNRLSEQRSTWNQRKLFAKQEISANDNKIIGIQAELDRIDIDEGRLATLSSAVTAVDARLAAAKDEFDHAAWEDQLHAANQQLRECEEGAERLNAKMVESTRKAGDVAKLHFMRNELRDRQQSLDIMCSAHGDKIAATVGAGWQPTHLERDFHAVLEQKKEDFSEAERQRDGVTRELEQIELRLHLARDALKKRRQEKAAAEKLIGEAIGDEPSDYSEILAQLEERRDIRRGDVDGFAHLRNYYSLCLKSAKENDVCRLCVRPFHAKKEQADFVARLERLISQGGQKRAEDELREYEADLAKAKQVGPSYDAYQRLSTTEIPQLEAESNAHELRREKVLTQIEEQDASVSRRGTAMKEVESLSKTVHNLVKYRVEMDGFEAQIEELAARHSEVGETQTLEEIQEQLGALGEQSRAIKKTIARVTGDKDRGRAQINALELETRDVRTKLTNATYHLEKKGTLVVRVDELRRANETQREAIVQADQALEKMAPDFAKAQTKYDDINQQGAERERELQQQARKISDSVYQVKLAEQEIHAYVEKGGPDQLAQCQQSVQQLEQAIARFEGEQRQVAAEINKVVKQKDENDRTKRTIADNVQYRRSVATLEKVRGEIAELEAKNAEVDRERFVQEADKMSVRHRKLSAEEATKIGVMKSKDNELTRLLNDWNTDYKDAAKNFKESHIKVETTKAAVEDLGRYGSALDKAIMKYHGLKMEEINRIVEELWKRTYQGTDVDTILIRSDNESGKGNRSYNYRVCMVKQDVEMDMRGRCSAGQKVLASILIRLALAECFGTNCGLIALDEPTTNLDRDNIRALAESLHDIINARRQQSNFQLIVITHDEDFLRYMKCADFCDNYYRVSRNDRQKSIIVRQSIAEVTSF